MPSRPPAERARCAPCSPCRARGDFRRRRPPSRRTLPRSAANRTRTRGPGLPRPARRTRPRPRRRETASRARGGGPHVVLQDESGATIIVEFPDAASCAPWSHAPGLMQQAREGLPAAGACPTDFGLPLPPAGDPGHRGRPAIPRQGARSRRRGAEWRGDPPGAVAEVAAWELPLIGEVCRSASNRRCRTVRESLFPLLRIGARAGVAGTDGHGGGPRFRLVLVDGD